jgi:hypothetical protein
VALRGSPLAGRRARLRAYAELERAGVLAPESSVRRPHLSDREARTAVLRRVRRCVHDAGADEPRDRELLLLMAWSGLLQGWLSRDERRLALRRLRDRPAPQRGAAALPWVGAAATSDLFHDGGFGDFGGGDAAGLEAGGASDGGAGGQ